MFCQSGVSCKELCWVCIFSLSLHLSGCIAAALWQLPLLACSRPNSVGARPALAPEGPCWRDNSPGWDLWGYLRSTLPFISLKAPLWVQWTTNNQLATRLSLLVSVLEHRISLPLFGSGMGKTRCSTPPEAVLSSRSLWCFMLTPS